MWGPLLRSKGIVEGDDYRSLLRKDREDLFEDGGKEGVYISASLAVETIVGAPVVLLAAAGADEIGNGGLLRAEQN